MPLVYFAASAFVKLLTTETGSSLASAPWDDCDAALSSRLAYPEAHAVHGTDAVHPASAVRVPRYSS